MGPNRAGVSPSPEDETLWTKPQNPVILTFEIIAWSMAILDSRNAVMGRPIVTKVFVRVYLQKLPKNGDRTWKGLLYYPFL
jgi:hypothetical protein